MPVLLMRNLRPAAGLCNGVRMIVRRVGTRVITCQIAVGDHAGSTALIPRVITCPSDDKYPFPFQRLQFPLQPAFALTINKSQGQTLSFVGLMLTPPVFTHGLNVAMSRVGSPDNIRILTPQDDQGRFLAKNVVFREALI
jgi:ATP-dependent DNA helicase PIF1